MSLARNVIRMDIERKRAAKDFAKKLPKGS